MAEVKIPDSLPWSANGDGPGSIQNSTGGWLTNDDDVNERTAYIVHAANCYPALVEALNAIARDFPGRAEDHYDTLDRVQETARAALKAAGVEL